MEESLDIDRTREKLLTKLKELEELAQGLEDEQVRKLISDDVGVSKKKEEWESEKVLRENEHRDDVKRLTADVDRLREDIEKMNSRVDSLKER